MEKIALGHGLEPNTALGFASCCISLSPTPLYYFFPYCTRGSALISIYMDYYYSVKVVFTTYVTRFYRTDPNRTSGKIKLTPPVDSYTIVLQVLTLSTTQTTRGWFLHTSFLGGVECSNGGFRPCEGPGLARVSGLLVDSLIMLARRVLC